MCQSNGTNIFEFPYRQLNLNIMELSLAHLPLSLDFVQHLVFVSNAVTPPKKTH